MTSREAGGIFAGVWILGWLTFAIIFTRGWLRDRREDPKHTPPYFPWDRVLIIGLFAWWLALLAWGRDWLLRRRGKP